MKTKSKTLDYIKAARKGSRDAQLEHQAGWVSVKRIHKSKKSYTRKKKHKKRDDC